MSSKADSVKQSGYVIDDIGVAVDYWRVVNKPFVRFFFLTHAHCDHLDGLTPSWIHPIYCSSTTAKITSELKGVNIKIFKQLELNTLHEILDDNGQWFMNLYLIDADHCPGSVMFLMMGKFGRFLCTGDFRYERLNDPDGILQHPSTKINFELLKQGPIDRLYLDTTNWKITQKFAPRKQVAREMIETMEENEDCQFLIAVPQVYLGKEDLLVEIARSFGNYVSVSSKRLAILQILEMPDVFSCSPNLDNTQIRLIKLAKARAEFQRMLRKDDCNPFLIVASSMSAKLRFNFHENVRCVMYSDHSDHFEIESFLKQLEIRRIIGVPNGLTAEEMGKFTSGVPKQFHVEKEFRMRPLKSTKVSDCLFTKKRLRPTGLAYDDDDKEEEASADADVPKSTKIRRPLFSQSNCSIKLTTPGSATTTSKDLRVTLTPLIDRVAKIKSYDLSATELIVFETALKGNCLLLDDPEIIKMAEGERR